MGLFKKLAQMFTPSERDEERAYWLYVQCSRCGEKIRARVDLHNDLSPLYPGTGVYYFSRKVLIGQQRCFQKVEVEMNFDENRRLTERKISGGSYITEEEFGKR